MDKNRSKSRKAALLISFLLIGSLMPNLKADSKIKQYNNGSTIKKLRIYLRSQLIANTLGTYNNKDTLNLFNYGVNHVNHRINNNNYNANKSIASRDGAIRIIGTEAVNCRTSSNTYISDLEVTITWDESFNEAIEVTLDGGNMQVIAVGTSSPQMLTFSNIPADGSINHEVIANFSTRESCADTFSVQYPLACPPDLGIRAGEICQNRAGVIAGTVYEDWNYDGIMNQSDTIGIRGVKIALYDANNNLVDSTYTDTQGNYEISGLVDALYRVEFSLAESISSWARPSHVGADNGTMVQFARPTDCINLALVDPSNYCETVPIMALGCFINGDPALNGSASGLDALVAFPNDSEGFINNGKQSLALGDDVGAVWGLAYNNRTQNLYTTAFLKRHSALGPLGPGGIYQINNSNPAMPVVTPWLDVATLGINVGVDPRTLSATDTLPADYVQPSHDSLAFNLVGRMSLGDIEVSPDGSLLYVMNLQERELLAIDVATQTLAATYPVTDPGCSDGDYQAFAIKIYKGEVYIGVTCTAETSQLRTDLYAHVMQLNKLSGNFTSIASFALDHPRGDAIEQPPLNRSASGDWMPWIDTWQSTVNFVYTYPQPLLSNMEFDVDGSIILSIFDRFGHQGGTNNYPPDNSDENRYTSIAAGDLIRICHDGQGNYQLENNAACFGMNATSGANNQQGPGFGEYYYEEEFYDGSFNRHEELSVGGLALQYGSGNISATIYDPFRLATGGIAWYDNKMGNTTYEYEVYVNSTPGAFAKANGLGDVALLCALPPLEIGNYVWNDANENGIQDANEPPIAGVNMVLYDSDCNQVATATTDVNGHYYFNKDGGLNQTWAIRGDSLQANSTYYIAAAATGQYSTGQLIVEGKIYDLTLANSTTKKQIDNDGIEGTMDCYNGIPYTTVNTGDYGNDDHTYDFGFVYRADVPCYSTSCLPLLVEKK